MTRYQPSAAYGETGMEPNRVEINPGPGGVVVTINGAILPGATVVFVDGNRLDFVDGRVVVSSVPDTAADATNDGNTPPTRRIAL
jgi:hypothetical protein